MERKIKNYPGYVVDTNGNIYSYKYGYRRKLHPGKNRGGYLQVSLCKNGIRKTLSVHRIVASAFLKPQKLKKTVNHINGIKDDNRLQNLEFATYSENTLHAFYVLKTMHPLSCIGRTGTKNKRSKPIIVINPDGTEQLFIGYRETARKLKISHKCIRNVLLGVQHHAAGYKFKLPLNNG